MYLVVDHVHCFVFTFHCDVYFCNKPLCVQCQNIFVSIQVYNLFIYVYFYHGKKKSSILKVEKESKHWACSQTCLDWTGMRDDVGKVGTKLCWGSNGKWRYFDFFLPGKSQKKRKGGWYLEAECGTINLRSKDRIKCIKRHKVRHWLLYYYSSLGLCFLVHEIIGKLKSTVKESLPWSQIHLDVNSSSTTYPCIKWGEFYIPHRIMIKIIIMV